ncbi:B12-binding domain-containing radical SAM protein [uncultured Desulfobulbus sp.]|uniref:B12-binding domain-containing radical SAM protein n=1 Tax=uncultured Desulfobulbus sp. TaxID=239745 RepID=UPI0029C646DA|nr:cobalamin-dependent protein [uncultured Desulfobulbus sp.]
MRILIVATNRERSPQTLIPLGACCIASAAESAGHEVYLLDLGFSRRHIIDVESAVRRIRPDVIGLSVRNLDNCDSRSSKSYLPEIRQIVDACRRNSKAEIVLGGPAVSISPREVALHLGCEYAVIGEGEIPFIGLLQALESGADPSAVQGVVAVGGGDHSAPIPVRTNNPGSLPYPNPAKWLDLRRYAASDTSMPIQTKRGCEFNCSYCSYPLLEGHAYRLYEPDAVSRQIEMARVAGMRGIEFVDSIFGFPQAHAIACCESTACVLGQGISVGTSDLNPLACTPEMVDAMNLAQFTTVGVTAESGSDTILQGMNKGFRTDDLRRAVKNLNKLNAQRMWIFMFGGPGETMETARETVGFIESLPHDALVFITHGIRVLPGTALRQRLVNDEQIDAGDNLLEPRFYYSPHVVPEQVNQILGDSSFPASNIATITDCSHPLAPALQRLAAMIGMQPPYWRGLPTINRIRRILRV